MTTSIPPCTCTSRGKRCLSCRETAALQAGRPCARCPERGAILSHLCKHCYRAAAEWRRNHGGTWPAWFQQIQRERGLMPRQRNLASKTKTKAPPATSAPRPAAPAPRELLTLTEHLDALEAGRDARQRAGVEPGAPGKPGKLAGAAKLFLIGIRARPIAQQRRAVLTFVAGWHGVRVVAEPRLEVPSC